MGVLQALEVCISQMKGAIIAELKMSSLDTSEVAAKMGKKKSLPKVCDKTNYRRPCIKLDNNILTHGIFIFRRITYVVSTAPYKQNSIVFKIV